MAKILAVDDAVVMRKLVKATLETQGHEVITMEDGLKALGYARKEAVDLVITDQNMPNLKGVTLVKRLRQIPAYGKVPILMLTTESDEAVKQKAKDNGADGWVQKPIVAERLIKGVDRVLSKFGLH